MIEAAGQIEDKARLGDRLRTRSQLGPTLILLPGIAWLILFYVLPTLIMVRVSLLDSVREPTQLTIHHYLEVFGTDVYVRVALKSARFAITTTIILLFLCFPVAYFLAKKTVHQKALLILLMVPFWTSQVLRAFAWIILLSRSGMINTILQRIVVDTEPLQLLYNSRAVTAGLVYSYIPYMVLPLYAAIGKIEDELLQASADLGAGKFQTLRTITIPLALPGIVSGVALVLVASLTDVLAPTLLGGASDAMISSVIFNIFTMAANWPLGSAVSFLLFVVLIATAVITMATSNRVRYEEAQ